MCLGRVYPNLSVKTEKMKGTELVVEDLTQEIHEAVSTLRVPPATKDTRGAH